MNSPEYSLPNEEMTSAEIADRLTLALVQKGQPLRWYSSDGARIYIAGLTRAADLTDEEACKLPKEQLENLNLPWQITSALGAESPHGDMSLRIYYINPGQSVRVTDLMVNEDILKDDVAVVAKERERAIQALEIESVNGLDLPSLIDYARIENALFDLEATSRPPHIIQVPSALPLSEDEQLWEVELSQS